VAALPIAGLGHDDGPSLWLGRPVSCACGAVVAGGGCGEKVEGGRVSPKFPLISL